MRIALTGASGFVGYPLATGLVARGHEVTTLGRQPVANLPHLPWALGEAPDLSGFDALVHFALSHLPGKYRGGEGQEPAAFRTANLDGSLRLFEAADRAGARVVFASTRAVYGDYPAGTALSESMPLRPDTLYGKLKAEAEAALGDRDIILRMTGIYGPPIPQRGHKWQALFADFRRGAPIASRVATEVHADDVTAAVDLLLPQSAAGGAYNVSDLLLDRRDLLSEYAALTGITTPLPPRADAQAVSSMDTARLAALGWQPQGRVALRSTLSQIVAAEAV